jgi:hypothetical protein
MVLTRERALAFLLSTVQPSIPKMSSRLKSIIALWFVVQIVLPFTAPLQTCDLSDLLGAKNHHSVPVSPESSTTPTTAETEADANSFVSPIEPSALRLSTGLVAPDELTASGPAVASTELSPSPQVQRSILRL